MQHRLELTFLYNHKSMKSNINDFFLNISHDVRKHHLNLKLDEPLESIFLESVARNDLTQRCIYESAYLIARCFEISTSDRICTALLEILSILYKSSFL